MRPLVTNSTGVSTKVYLTNIIGIPATGIRVGPNFGCNYILHRNDPVPIVLTGIEHTGPWVSGGFAEVSGGMPGLYRLDFPNTVFATDSTFAIIQFTGTNIASPPMEFPIVGYDPLNSGTNFANALLDMSNGVETNFTLRQALRLILSATAAELSGAGTTAVTIRDVNDTKTRITATVTASGNRTAVSYDVS